MGKSSADSSTKTTTTYNTTTSTSIGDIGFTGKDALNFESALLQYNLASQQQAQNTINNFVTHLSSFGIVPQAASAQPTGSDQESPASGGMLSGIPSQYLLYGGIALILFLVLKG